MVAWLASLLIEEGGRWEEFPGWARFLLSLGFEVGRKPLQDGRLIVAIATPTRVLAAATVSSGVVVGCVSSETPSRDRLQHFQALIGMAPGTTVIFERGGKQFLGELRGVIELYGEPFLRVRIQDPKAGGETHHVRESDAFKLSLASATQERLPTKPHGVHPVVRPLFVRAVFGEHGFQAVSSTTSLDCLIVGAAGSITNELNSIKLAIGGNGRRLEEGRLSDLARARQVLGPKRVYRSYIVSSTARLQPRLSTAGPKCVVFDGATGFLKWRHHWRRSHWLVVLDKTGPRCSEGAAAVNGEYERGNLGLVHELKSLIRPNSVELTAFYGPSS